MINYRNTVRQMSGYVPGKHIDEVKEQYHLEEVIKLASNENPYGCSPKSKEAMINFLQSIELYPDDNCTNLRKTLSKKLNIDGQKIVFGAGSDELLGVISQVFINPGDEAITCTPSFSRYLSVVQLMDGNLIEVPVKNHTYDLDGILKRITDKTKIIFLANPNNPTGTCFLEDDQKVFLDKVPSNIIVVFDEAYYEYVENKDYPNSLDMLSKYPNIIILRTFSKAYGLASLRVGYGIACEEIIELLNRVRNPFTVSTLAQEAALAGLNDVGFVKNTVENNLKVKNFLYNEFENMGLSYIPTETNFIMVDIKRQSKDIFESLLKQGIIVRPGFYFGMNTYLRVTIGTKEQMEIFIVTLKQILNEI